MLHSYVTDMAARVTPTIQIPNLLPTTYSLPPKTYGKYQAEVRHLCHAKKLLIMGLFDVLIANMMFISGATNIEINIA